jgi:ATP-binding cassette subfamily B (MDR/TAP) protein 1
LNVHGIRAMAYEPVFESQFILATDNALSMGVRVAFVEDNTFGVANGFFYAAEALLFYVGAVLIAYGTYTYLQMAEALNLVVFTVSIGSQLMAFSEFSFSDSVFLLKLEINTEESRGILRLSSWVLLPSITSDFPTANAPMHPFSKTSTSRSRKANVLPSLVLQVPGDPPSLLSSSIYQRDSGSISIGRTTLPSWTSDTYVTSFRHHPE